MLGSKAKRELKKNQRRILIDSIEIGIPSPLQILNWGERQLPNGQRVGQIKNSKTVNYKKFTPLRDGLFCERIFGPVNSFVCACGKRQLRADVTFCEKCQVEYTDQGTRRYRLGYISLVSPVAHIWYLKGRPSYLSLFLGKRKKKIVTLAYCNAYLVEQAFCHKSQSKPILGKAGVVSATEKREAHGTSQHVKDINSFLSNRRRFDTFFRKENEKDSQTEIPLLAKTTSQSSLFNRFEEQIKSQRSVPSFFHLLIEVLDNIEKDIILTDSLITTKNSRTLFSSFSTKKAFLEKNKLNSKEKESLHIDFHHTFKKEIKNTVNWSKSVCDPYSHPPETVSKGTDQKRETLTNQNEKSQPKLYGSFYEGQRQESLSNLLGQENTQTESDLYKESFQPVSFLQRDKPKLRATAQTVSRIGCLYNRAHTFPFLPSLICKYNLRDELLNFLNSVPLTQDKPLPFYCQLERRYPLRDVHQFMSEQIISKFQPKKPTEYVPVRDENLQQTKLRKKDPSWKSTAQRKFRTSALPNQRQGLNSSTAPTKGKNNFNQVNNEFNTYASASSNATQAHKVLKSLTFIKREGQAYSEHTILEELASLRHLLYTALLQKTWVFQVKTLRARTRQTSVFLTAISRQVFIHNSIQLLNLGKDRTGFSSKNSQKGRISKEDNFQENLQQSPFLKAGITANGRNPNSKFATFVKSHLSEDTLQWRKFFSDLQYREKEKAKNTSLRLLATKKASTALAKQNFASQEIENFIDTNQLKNGYLRVATRFNKLQELSSLIGTANSLQLESPEKFYRSILFDKIWLRSSLLKKHFSRKLFKSTNQFETFETTKKNFLGGNRQGYLHFNKQGRLASSLVHAFQQNSENRKEKQLKRQQFVLEGINLCHSYSIANMRAKKLIFAHEKRLIHRVYNFKFLYSQMGVFKEKFTISELVLPSRQVLRPKYKHKQETKNKQIPQLAFHTNSRDKTLRLLSNTSISTPSTTTPKKTTIFEKKRDVVIEKGKVQVTKTEGKNESFQDVKSKGESAFFDGLRGLFSSTLSFFLILPHYDRKMHNQSNKLALVSTPFRRTADSDLKENHTSVQIQLTNGNSQFFETLPTFLNSLYDHTNKNKNESFKFKESLSENKIKTEISREDKYSKAIPISYLLTSEQSQKGGRSAESNGRSNLTTIQKRDGRPTTPITNNNQQENLSFSPLELTATREILSYTGGGALQELLHRFDTQIFANFLFQDVQATREIYKRRVSYKKYPSSRLEKRVLTRLCRRIYKNSRRFKIAQLLTRCKRRPEWMLISVLPVLPPDLRPILQMSESVVVASDLNNLYQRVIYRNNRFHKLSFVDFHLVTAIQRLVQDAVDRLIENGKGGSKVFSTPNGRPLKSLADTLKGKKGRFRLNLLGKRVDFSGRSVIVVSPNLKIHECGLPREIALELYHYFLLRKLILKREASSIVMAKKIIKQKMPFLWDALRTLIYNHPVLLNRAPTLHRLGIQAFQPKLVAGNAILLHPLVCSGFNADFDGDQMGVHLPLSTQARAEAWDLLWSRNNLLSPATGQPVLLPSQDMVLGFYYMTQSFVSRVKENKSTKYRQTELATQHSVQKEKEKNQNQEHEKRETHASSYLPVTRKVMREHKLFFNSLQLIRAFQKEDIHLHTPVYLQWQGKLENEEASQRPLELRINNFGGSTYIYPHHKQRKDESTSQFSVYVRTTAGRVLVNSLIP